MLSLSPSVTGTVTDQGPRARPFNVKTQNYQVLAESY